MSMCHRVRDMELQHEAGYKRLRVWKASHEFALDIYSITKKFPKNELFGLTSQIRRAAVSIVANIVEGQTRSSKKEFLQFLSISNGSLVEVEYYLELTKDLGMINQKEFDALHEKRRVVGLLLHALIKALRNS